MGYASAGAFQSPTYLDQPLGVAVSNARLKIVGQQCRGWGRRAGFTGAIDGRINYGHTLYPVVIEFQLRYGRLTVRFVLSDPQVLRKQTW